MNIFALIFLGIEVSVCRLTILACIESLRALCGGKRGKSAKIFPTPGLVLFQIGQQVEVPAQLEVYARSAELISTQGFLNYPDYS